MQLKKYYNTAIPIILLYHHTTIPPATSSTPGARVHLRRMFVCCCCSVYSRRDSTRESTEGRKGWTLLAIKIQSTCRAQHLFQWYYQYIQLRTISTTYIPKGIQNPMTSDVGDAPIRPAYLAKIRRIRIPKKPEPPSL